MNIWITSYILILKMLKCEKKGFFGIQKYITNSVPGIALNDVGI